MSKSKNKPLEIGEVRRSMALRTQGEIAKIIDRETRFDEFYIIIRSYEDREESHRTGLKVIRTKFMITQERPHPWIGTVAVYVNRKKGLVQYLHALPADKPTDAALELSDDASEVVAASAQINNSPIVWAASNN